MISWAVAITLGLFSALLVIGVGGTGAFIRSRRQADNTVMDMLLSAATTCVLLAIYAISQSAGDDTLRLSIGCVVAAAATAGVRLLKTWINTKL